MNVYVEIPAENLSIYDKEIASQIASGENLILTYKGRPMAKIIPLENNESDEIFGLWKEHKENISVDDYVRKKRKGRAF